MKKAVYAGSFDPLTNGHMWIIEHAATIFDQLVIAIGHNPQKSYTLPLDVRLEMLNQATDKLSNIELTILDNEFLVHYAKRLQANFIIRGVRNSNDYEYERSMHYINSDLCSDIDTVFLMPPRKYAEVSSSMVKGLIGPDGWQDIIKQYIPISVFNKLEQIYSFSDK